MTAATVAPRMTLSCRVSTRQCNQPGRRVAGGCSRTRVSYFGDDRIERDTRRPPAHRRSRPRHAHDVRAPASGSASASSWFSNARTFKRPDRSRSAACSTSSASSSARRTRAGRGHRVGGESRAGARLGRAFRRHSRRRRHARAASPAKIEASRGYGAEVVLARRHQHPGDRARSGAREGTQPGLRASVRRRSDLRRRRHRGHGARRAGRRARRRW